MNWKRFLCMVMVLLVCPFMIAFGASAQDPIVLTCWVYYNGVQEQEFDGLLKDFNDTVGMEQGIFVESYSLGNVSELADHLVASAKRDVGAELMPDIFASYADTAYQLKQLGVVADLNLYLTQEDIDQYIAGYMEEGRMGEDGSLSIFPVAKSSELLLLNSTAWDRFAAETGADETKLSTWEGIVELSHTYYDWTDAQTSDIENDGKAFYGRDAMANYMLIGSLQLGTNIFEVQDGKATLHFDKTVMKKLWNSFYIPYVNGWFAAYGRFRSDDIKTGQIIALVGSTSGAIYFPTEVTYDDGTNSPISCSVHILPNFEGAKPMATQQGAGFVVTKSTPEREQAAVTFLKWFTQTERNISFSLESGYMPVSKASNDMDTIRAEMDQMDTDAVVRNIIETSAQIVNDYQLYTNKPFLNGVQARGVLEKSMLNWAKAAVQERISLEEQGISHNQAAAQLTGEDRFEAWFEATQTELEKVLAQ